MVSISVSLIAAFIPLLFMGGIVGRLFREFSVTLAFAIVVSTVVSLSVTPMICAYFVRAAPSRDATWLDRLVEGVLARMMRFYDRTLAFVLEHRALALIVFVATIALTVGLYIKTPKGYFPQDDTGLIFGGTQASTDISFEAMEQLQQKAMDIVLADPAVAGFGSSVGASGFNASVNRGRMFISLKPLDRARQCEHAARGRAAARQAQPDPRHPRLHGAGAGPARRRPAERFAISVHAVERRYRRAAKLGAARCMDRVKQVAGVIDVTTDREQGGLQANVIIDRAAAARLGVRIQDIDNALNNAFSQRQISTIYTAAQPVSRHPGSRPQIPARPERPHPCLRRGRRQHAGAAVGGGACRARHRAAGGQPSGPVPVGHHHLQLAPNVPIEDVTAAIEQAVAEMHIPDTIHADFAGDVQAFKQSVGAQPLLLLAALIAVYIVLGVLYESLAHPLTIISTLPSAGLGALLALQLFNTELTVIAFIGIILLIGIVKKNGIMMVDFALDGERRRGLAAAAGHSRSLPGALPADPDDDAWRRCSARCRW